MASEHVKLIGKALSFFIPYGARRVFELVGALHHNWTWHDTSNAKHVVVIGGSFAGIELIKRLIETLPTGYKVIWIEKNSHLNYSFNFPRFSVMTGHEHEAFIPYSGVEASAPAGILKRIQDIVVSITDTHVILKSGNEISYAYLALATGSSQPLPVQVVATDRWNACLELQSVQRDINDSQKIAIVGGGAVGVELSSDIKDFYPEKDVTLIHSRDRLVNGFGKRLGEYTLSALQDELKIRILLNERPKMPDSGNMAKSASLTFADGRTEEFDLIIGCTGQRPNSAILATLLPNSISKENSRILVQPTLQVRQTPGASTEPQTKMRIFALGDVAEHGGPRMARAGWMQAGIVQENILSMIQGHAPSRTYKPHVFLESAIKLTLGKTHNVVYSTETDGSDVMVPSRNNRLDLGIERAWKMFNVGSDFNDTINGPVNKDNLEASHVVVQGYT